MLVSTAARLRDAVRAVDLVARLGGDEFAVLVEEIDRAAVDVVVERVRAASTAPHPTSAGDVVCGFTVGVAEARDGDLPYELLGRADSDLYGRKPLQR